MITSDKGKALIARYESLVLHAYADPKTHAEPYTIGYGFTFFIDEDGSIRKVRPGDHITKDEADIYFDRLLARVFGAAVNQYVKVPITQGMFDAIVSWTWNLGVQRLAISSALRLLNQRRYLDAINSFGLWVDPGTNVEVGLRRRRNAEKALFLSEGIPQ